jgi:hypothetical protein
VTPASDRVPPVFDGERVRVYALAEAVSAGTATLRGVAAGRAVAFEIPIDPAAAVEGDTIATLAARERIRTLEEEGEYLESRGSRQRRARTAGKAAADIVALAVKYRLASRETSFVAIEHRDAPLAERAELRRVPVALTSGWGGLRRPSVSYLVAPDIMALGAGPCVPHAVGATRASMQDAWFEEAPDESCAMAEMPRLAYSRVSAPPAKRRDAASPRRATRVHDQLIDHQRADGSWDLTAAFADALSLRLRDLEKALRGAVGDPDVARRALATAVALEWLEKHAAAQRGEWELLAQKAMAWLSASRTEPAAGQSWNAWLDAARRLL